jgi:hypothetical protein
MSIRTTVLDLLKADAAIAAAAIGGIHPGQLPDAPEYPAVVLTKAFGSGEYDLEGDVGVEDARLQIDVVGTGQAQADDLAQLIRRFLSGYRSDGADSSGSCVIQSVTCINDFDLTETGTERGGPRLKRRVLEFRVWNMEV